MKHRKQYFCIENCCLGIIVLKSFPKIFDVDRWYRTHSIEGRKIFKKSDRFWNFELLFLRNFSIILSIYPNIYSFFWKYEISCAFNRAIFLQIRSESSVYGYYSRRKFLKRQKLVFFFKSFIIWTLGFMVRPIGQHTGTPQP